MSDAMGAVPALALDTVDVRFGARPGLVALSLSIGAGERVALVGPSGVGKTSLLRAIAGLQAIERGRVRVGGRDVTALPPEQRGAVYLHQSPSLFPHLSVIDNVGFPFEVRGSTRDEARARAMPLLARVQMEAFATRAPSTLSGGQRHRVALARALAAEPAVLLLDEPFAALDPTLRDDVRSAVLSLLAPQGGEIATRRQPAVLLVTHDIDEAALVADRIVVLLDGRVRQDASPGVVLSSPSSLEVARFLGVPNVVRGVSTSGRFRCPVGSCVSSTPDGAAWLVARADGFVVRPRSEAARGDVPNNASARAGNDADRSGVVGVVTALEQRVSGATVRVEVADNQGGMAVVQARADVAAQLAVGDTVELSMDVARVHVVAETAADV